MTIFGEGLVHLKLIDSGTRKVPYKIAFMKYQTKDDAQKMIRLDGFVLYGWELSISFKAYPCYLKQIVKMRIYNFPLQLTNVPFKNYLQQFGLVTNCVVTRDISGYHKGMAFAFFIDRESAEKAYHALHNKNKWGSTLSCVLSYNKVKPIKQASIKLTENHLRKNKDKSERTRWKSNSENLIYLKLHRIRKEASKPLLRVVLEKYGEIRFIECMGGRDLHTYRIAYKQYENALEAIKNYKQDKELSLLIDTNDDASYIEIENSSKGSKEEIIKKDFDLGQIEEKAGKLTLSQRKQYEDSKISLSQKNHSFIGRRCKSLSYADRRDSKSKTQSVLKINQIN